MEAQIEQQQAAMEESGLSVSAEGIPTNYDNLSTSAQLMTFFAGNTTLIMAVLISLFVGSEFNQGTIKKYCITQLQQIRYLSVKTDRRDPCIHPLYFAVCADCGFDCFCPVGIRGRFL